MDDFFKKTLFEWYEALTKCMRGRDAAVKELDDLHHGKWCESRGKWLSFPVGNPVDKKNDGDQQSGEQAVVKAAKDLHDAVLAFEAFNDATPDVNVSEHLQDRCAELDRAIIDAQYSVVAAVGRLPDPISKVKP